MRFKHLYFLILILSCGSQSLIAQSRQETSTLPNHYTLNKHTSNQGDINLSELTVNFTETDLTIPGKNGLNVIIQRGYNNKNWRHHPNTNPVQNHRWGAWAGKGWHFKLAPRAFIAHTDTHVRIAIDMNGTSDLYQLNIKNGDTKFKAHRPGNFTKVFWDKNKNEIQMRTEDGKIYTFKTWFYGESYVRQDTHYVRGFFLNEIKDQFENKIIFSYQKYRGNHTNHYGNAEMNHILGNI